VQREYPGGWSAFVAEVCVPALAEPATVHGVTCSGCRATETGGVDAVRNGWRRVTGRLMCRRCATGFPVWMRDRI
jgi:hypothetical protein